MKQKSEGQKPKAKKKAAPKKAAEKKIAIQKSIGAGDVIEKITKATGIKKAIEFFADATGVDCGCDERKTRFNKISFKYGARVKIERCPTKHELERLDVIFNRSKYRMIKEDAAEFAKIYSDIFGTKFEIWCSVCAEKWMEKIREMKSVFAFYRDELKDFETIETDQS